MYLSWLQIFQNDALFQTFHVLQAQITTSKRTLSFQLYVSWCQPMFTALWLHCADRFDAWTGPFINFACTSLFRFSCVHCGGSSGRLLSAAVAYVTATAETRFIDLIYAGCCLL
jgi:hypothetical protein